MEFECVLNYPSLSDLESNYDLSPAENMDKPLDVFVSYRRSNGSQLASLLKVCELLLLDSNSNFLTLFYFLPGPSPTTRVHRIYRRGATGSWEIR